MRPGFNSRWRKHFQLAAVLRCSAWLAETKGCNTQGSHVITHRSTNWACRCLTSQIGRDGVLSPEYGRIHLWGKHSCWPRVIGLRAMTIGVPWRSRGGSTPRERTGDLGTVFIRVPVQERRPEHFPRHWWRLPSAHARNALQACQKEDAAPRVPT